MSHLAPHQKARLRDPSFLDLFFLPLPALPCGAPPSANSAPTYYYEQDFISNPNLIALPTQVVVLTLLPASQGVSSLQQHIVRYSLNAGNYSFCLGSDPSLTSLTLTSSSGKPILTVSSGVCSPDRSRLRQLHFDRMARPVQNNPGNPERCSCNFLVPM